MPAPDRRAGRPLDKRGLERKKRLVTKIQKAQHRENVKQWTVEAERQTEFAIENFYRQASACHFPQDLMAREIKRELIVKIKDLIKGHLESKPLYRFITAARVFGVDVEVLYIEIMTGYERKVCALCGWPIKKGEDHLVGMNNRPVHVHIKC